MTDQATEKVKRPASQYYWGDWFKDLALQACTLPSRGLWHEMNCLMHQGEPYGHLTMPNGKPIGPVELANLCKISTSLCKKLLAELEGNGVFSKADSGAIFCRRMVRDEDIRNRRAAGGKEGAEHGIKGAEAGSKGGRPSNTKGGKETPLPGFEEPPLLLHLHLHLHLRRRRKLTLPRQRPSRRLFRSVRTAAYLRFTGKSYPLSRSQSLSFGTVSRPTTCALVGSGC